MTAGLTPPPPGGGVDPRTLAFLQSGKAFGGARPLRRIDTHAASIFLTADRAWKLKRPVSLGYLDFTTAEARHRALLAENRLNRRTAPALYHGVHAITRGAGDELALDGPGAPVDWLLEMDRFPDDALLGDRVAGGTVEPATWTLLADVIARFHADAAIVLGPGAADRFQKVVAGNGIVMTRYSGQLGPDRIEALCQQVAALAKALAPTLERRGRRGHVRRCHGDLHLRNIALLDGVPTLFDCLEFDDELARIDVLYDLAFLLMDLWYRGLRFEANLVFNRYLDVAPDEDDGIGLMPLFMAVRAQVRAHVAAARAAFGSDPAAADEAAGYLSLAERLLQPAPRRLIAIGGLAGSGKSTIARRLGGSLGRPPGARILRSDLLRKRRAGVSPETRLPATAYGGAARDEVYAELERTARLIVADGETVIADAMFSRPAERARIGAVAAAAGIDFTGIWLDAPGNLRAERVAGRGPDASDATISVVRQQEAAAIEPPRDWIRVDAAASVDEVAAEVARRLGVALV